MRYLLPLGCLVLALAGAAHGQTPRLRFIDLPPPDRVIMGRFTLYVSDDPFTRPSHTRTVIRLDGNFIAECYRLPCSLAWETDGVEDGRHLLQLALVDERIGHTLDRIVDERTITIRNHDKRFRKDEDEPKKPMAREREKTEDVAKSAQSPVAPPNREEVHRELPRMDPIVHDSVQKHNNAKPAPAASIPSLRNLNATAIIMNGRKLCVGLMDGGITIYDTVENKGTIVAGPPGAGEVRAIAAATGTVWWLTAPAIARATTPKAGAASAPASVLGPQLCAYNVDDGSLATYDVSAVGARFEPRQIFAWEGKVALVSGSSGSVFNPKTGEIVDLNTVLPAEAARDRQRGANVRFASNGSVAVAASVADSEPGQDGSPSLTVRIWRSRGGDWYGGEPESVSSAGAGATAVSLTVSSLSIVSPVGVTTVGVSGRRVGGDPLATALPAGVTAPDARTQVVCAGANVWWLRGGALFHADTEHQTTEALFPWNVKGLQARSVAADRDGVWVATSAGVRRVSLDAPDSESGYGGFVRARLGHESTEAVGPSEQKLAAAIESWQGTPYLWGGESRKGVDCSGFVMLAFRDAGVDLPHGSDNLRGYELGQRVMDELRYGDVLVYPGHTAIYIGNGETAETVISGNRGVGKSTVWRRSDVVVRRFLNVAMESRQSRQSRSFASRGGKPPIRKAVKSSTASGKKKRS